MLNVIDSGCTIAVYYKALKARNCGLKFNMQHTEIDSVSKYAKYVLGLLRKHTFTQWEKFYMCSSVADIFVQ